MVFLQGMLNIEIIEGKDLTNHNTCFSTMKDVTDPYVTVDIMVGGASTEKIIKTSTIKNSLNPQWNEKFDIKMSHNVETIQFSLKDQHFIRSERIGKINIRVEDLLREQRNSGFYPVKDNDGKPAASLNISIQYTPADIPDSAKKMVLLRGYLNVKLLEAKDLPNKDASFFNINCLNSKDTSDPFAQVRIGSSILCKTDYVSNHTSPKWEEASFKVPVCHEGDKVHIEILDHGHFSDGMIGKMSLKLEDLMKGKEMEGWYPLDGCDGQIKLSFNFIPKNNLKRIFEVPDCYFPMRKGCRVTLYQDAHCPPLPIFKNVPSDTGDIYDAPCAWMDLTQDLNNAQKFIYMTGWSVSAACKLKRDESDGPAETIGELLKRKAEAGVRVLIMVWDETASTGMTPAGLMETHDEETATYFADTDVEVAKVPRDASTTMLNLDGLVTKIAYTHHQKTLIMDRPTVDGDTAQTILAYVGGLDVTDGRWDTPDHVLFKSLLDQHKDDFYNGCDKTLTIENGPRQPWHDIHARVEGPVAKDVLDNFIERWKGQVKAKEHLLLTIGDELDFNAPAKVKEGNEWNTQLFRSITSDSAMFDMNRIQNLSLRKMKKVDDSIHRAYIHHIRNADRFMYFENQYFLGSSYSWHGDSTIKADHLIPTEITHRICEKMSAGEHIVAYIVIPMHPEGDPASAPMQVILRWQHRTMEMMYKKIAESIKKNKLKTKPTDYLTFFCLGKGECLEDIPKELPLPFANTSAAKLRDTARFMIYVHSKMLIVDDDYIIVGSANINQRSIAGTRDTEIAFGAYQPMHTREVSGDPRGNVHQFRMALWAEHLGDVEEVHNNPGTLECVQAVNEVAKTNWDKYVIDEPCKITGHLLRYPVSVNGDGSVSNLENVVNFPDTKAPILGGITAIGSALPYKITV